MAFSSIAVGEYPLAFLRAWSLRAMSLSSPSAISASSRTFSRAIIIPSLATASHSPVPWKLKISVEIGTSTTPESVWTCRGSPAWKASQASSPSSPLKLLRTAWVFSLKCAPICDLFGASVTEMGREETLLATVTFFTLQSSETRSLAFSIWGSLDSVTSTWISRRGHLLFSLALCRAELQAPSTSRARSTTALSSFAVAGIETNGKSCTSSGRAQAPSRNVSW